MARRVGRPSSPSVPFLIWLTTIGANRVDELDRDKPRLD
jgi:hypothetical protein